VTSRPADLTEARDGDLAESIGSHAMTNQTPVGEAPTLALAHRRVLRRLAGESPDPMLRDMAREVLAGRLRPRGRRVPGTQRLVEDLVLLSAHGPGNITSRTLADARSPDQVL
jgi:hypothetical protein